MDQDFDDILDSVLATPKEGATPAAPAAVPPPPAAPVAAQPQPTAPAPAGTPPAAPATAASAEAAPAPTADQPVTPEVVLQAMQQQETQLAASLAQQFAMTPELVEEMQTDAVAATPKLLANVYMKAVQTGIQYIQKLVPTMIAAEVQRINTARDTEQAFFKQFPKLTSAHANDIKVFATQFRQANPQITREDLFTKVGAAVMAMHGLVNDPAAAPPTPKPIGFQPAVAAAPVVMSQPVPPSGFAGMGMDFDD